MFESQTHSLVVLQKSTWMTKERKQENNVVEGKIQRRSRRDKKKKKRLKNDPRLNHEVRCGVLSRAAGGEVCRQVRRGDFVSQNRW